MKTPFGFANWYTVVAFITSWALMWVLIETGWVIDKSAFTITVIFTVKSYGLTYLFNKIQHKLMEK